MANDLISRPGLLFAFTYADLQVDDKADADNRTPVAKGQLGFVRDLFGIRIMRYMHNALISTLATTAGGLYTRTADLTPTQAAGSTTTSLVFAAASFTANVQRDWAALFVTNGTSAGAAPEGEVGIVTAASTTTLTLDSNRPLSAAPNATGDTIRVYSLFDFIKAAAGDLNHNVFGVGIATNGITNGNWGVLQAYGYCPDTKIKTGTAVTIAKALIADTEQVTVSSTSADNLLVGYAPMTGNATNSGKLLTFINVFSPMFLTV